MAFVVAVVLQFVVELVSGHFFKKSSFFVSLLLLLSRLASIYTIQISRRQYFFSMFLLLLILSAVRGVFSLLLFFPFWSFNE